MFLNANHRCYSKPEWLFKWWSDKFDQREIATTCLVDVARINRKQPGAGNTVTENRGSLTNDERERVSVFKHEE